MTDHTALSAPIDVADDVTLDRARGGDVDALADLWVIYQPQLLRLLRTRGRSIAEDVASQVWVDVRRGIERFEGDGVGFRNWIFTIAVRRSIDENRREQRRPPLAAGEVAELADRRSVDPFSESLDGVIAMLTSLQPSAAEVVVLRVVHDLPVAEVAELTGQSEANVRVVTHRALAQLRRLLDEAPAIGGAAPDPCFA